MNRPKLILLVGPPGSGKTNYAEEYIRNNTNTIHLSSDNIRAELWGDAAIQGDNNEVFSLMQTRAIDSLNNGQSVVYDATNMTRKDRAYIINLCPKFVKIEAHVVWAPVELCVMRDTKRERTVGREVIDKMIKRFQPPYYDEGIDEIKVSRPNGFIDRMYADHCWFAMNIPHDNPHHKYKVLRHCQEAYTYAYKHGFSKEVCKAAIWHDVGKPYCKAFIDKHGNASEKAHFYQHQCVSSWVAYGFEDMDPLTIWLIGVHMDHYLNTKYLRNLPPYLRKLVDELHEADKAAH